MSGRLQVSRRYSRQHPPSGRSYSLDGLAARQRSTAPATDASDQLPDRTEAADREAGVLFRWFFRMTHGYGSARCRPMIDQDPAAGSPAHPLGFQHHELDPAPRKIDPQPVMPVEVTARLHVAVPSPDRTRPDGAMVGGRWHLASWQGQEDPFAAPSLRSTSRLVVRRCAHGSAEGEQERMTWGVLGRLLASYSSNRLVDPCDRAVLLLAFSGERQRSEVTRQPLDRHRDGPARRRTAASRHRHFNLPRHPAREPKASVVDEAGRVLLVGPGGGVGRWQGEPTPQGGAILWSLQYVV
jgi:hypothetical protein